MEKLGLEEEDCRMRVSCEIGRQSNKKIFDKKFDKTEKIDQNEKFDQREEFDQKIDHNDKLTENEGGPHQSFNLTMSKALMEVFT